jgi:hypothetical protein
MPRVRAALLTLATAASAVLLTPAAAQAADAGTTSTSDVVLSDECQRHEFDWVATVPASTYWQLDIKVLDPSGRTSEGALPNSNENALTGSFTQLFCSSSAPGTWTISTGGFYQLLPGVRLPLDATTTSFVVRKAQTDTTLAATPMRNGRWKVRADVREERTGGWFAPTGLDTRLQRLVDGRWKNLPKRVLTSTRGTSAVTVAFPRGTRLRGVTVAAGNYEQSVSNPVTLTGKKRR